LLIIDDFGIEAMDDKTASDFLTILEQRMGIRSLIIVGQVPIKQWHGQFSDPIKADAITDRLANQSYIIELSGKSMREKYGAMAQIRQETEHAKNS
jgi:DNA replication protein DnaC